MCRRSLAMRMGRLARVLIISLLALVIGPLLIPIPPVGEHSPEELAGPNSRFADVRGIRIHYQEAGDGALGIVLLHGFAASTFSWQEVMGPMSKWGRVIAFDRPAFGLTSRPMPGEWTGRNPYGVIPQADLTIGLMDQLGIDRAILVGHSGGGTVALLTALQHPERVQALVLEAPSIYDRETVPQPVRALLGTPQARRLGPLVMRYMVGALGERGIRMAWYDQERDLSDVIEGYEVPKQVRDWDRALWETMVAAEPVDLPDRVREIRTPTLVISGDSDRIVPIDRSYRAAQEMPDARMEVIPRCGHLPHEECAEAFLAAVEPFISAVAEDAGSATSGRASGSTAPHTTSASR
jgi:pimeloyl-ACP methyl ester carboxylesterase